MIKTTKRKNADNITGPPAVIRKKPDQALTKTEMVNMLGSMRSAMLSMVKFMESVSSDSKKTRQLVEQLHAWDKLRPHASNFNRVLEQEAEGAEARRIERERRKDGQAV